MEVKVWRSLQISLGLQRNILAICSAALLISNVILAFTSFTKDHMIVLVPSNLAREVEISNTYISNSYLEEMTTFFMSKMLDLTVSNFDYQTGIVLHYIHPNFYGHIKEFFKEEKSKYEKFNLTTHFVLKELVVDDKKVSVIAKGILVSRFGTTGKKEEQMTYKIKYDYTGAKLTIADFSIVKENEVIAEKSISK